jgi:hypothetical protein
VVVIDTTETGVIGATVIVDGETGTIGTMDYVKVVGAMKTDTKVIQEDNWGILDLKATQVHQA